MQKSIVVAVAIVAFLGFLVVGQLGGVGSACGVLIDFATAQKAEDGSLKSTMAEGVATQLGGLGNLILAGLGTLVLWLVKALNAIATMIEAFLSGLATRANSTTVASSDSQPAVDDETWDECERMLLKAIVAGDRKWTVMLAEKMHGKPYLTSKTPIPTPELDEVPNA